MGNQSRVHAFALVSALAAGLTVSDLARADDDKVIHGTECVAESGSVDEYSFDGVDISGSAVCPLVRDVVASGITNVLVRVDPGAAAVSCAVATFSPHGYIMGNDWTNWFTSSGNSAQTITIAGLDTLTNFSNGSYIVYCDSTSPFHIYSVKWREP